jgi:hypothetical protein
MPYQNHKNKNLPEAVIVTNSLGQTFFEHWINHCTVFAWVGMRDPKWIVCFVPLTKWTPMCPTQSYNYTIILYHKILSQRKISFTNENRLLKSSFFVSHVKLANKLETGFELQSHGSPQGYVMLAVTIKIISLDETTLYS